MKKKFDSFIRFLKDTIIYEIKEPIISRFVSEKKSNIDCSLEERKIILIQTPTHANLGDHAIAYAERKFAEKYFPDYKIIEIPYEHVYSQAKELRKVLSLNDFIFIVGGGNMGDLYVYEEYMRRYIIKYFKNVNIISFPQTITFSNTINGRLQLAKSKKVYNKNKNLLVIAREQKSYTEMKKVFGNVDVLLTPDIVLSLDMRKTLPRNKIVTCIRKDKESILSPLMIDSLHQRLVNKYQDVIITDTITSYDVSLNERDIELSKIWGLFSQSKVVITDRLHGMIFCAITGTPCIVFDNVNNKILESYNKWLTDINYIKFMNNQESNLDDILNCVQEVLKIPQNELKFNTCNEKFQPLVKYLRESV